MSSSNPNDITNEKNIKKGSEVTILSILDKSYYNRNIPEKNFEIPSKLISSSENEKEEQSNNITLFNALYNSLINKDHKSFLFCIQQNNETLIEETVKQMNTDCLNKFIEKAVDIFQSNSFYSKMILPWLQNILKHKKFEIFRKKNIENLKKIQIFIKDKIKCFDALCILKHKIEKINQLFCDNKKEKTNLDTKEDNNNNNETKDISNNDKPIIFEPLLTYYESEDEDEAKMKNIKKNKMEIEGFEEVEKNEEEEENEENNNMDDEKEESEEDFIDEEIDNMFLDENEKIKSIKKEKNENKEKDEEEEENEDNIEEEDD